MVHHCLPAQAELRLCQTEACASIICICVILERKTGYISHSDTVDRSAVETTVSYHQWEAIDGHPQADHLKQDQRQLNFTAETLHNVPSSE